MGKRKTIVAMQHRSQDIDLFAVGQEVRWIASLILGQAVRDLTDANYAIRWAAHDFILSPDFDYWADMIDLSADAAREALAQRLKDAMTRDEDEHLERNPFL